MQTVQIGQVWEDCDARRNGRTFKIVNIDGDSASCLNKDGNVTFAKLKRFIPKYYKLKNNSIATFSTITEEEQAPVHRIFDTITVIRRPMKASLVQECKNLWPGNWREAGPFLILNSMNNDFEISIRQLDEFNKPFEGKVKLYNFTIYSFTSAGLENCIKGIQDYFLVLNNELHNLIVGEI